MARKKKEVVPEVKEESKSAQNLIVEKIIKLSNVENFIEVQIIDSPTYIYEYLDFVDKEKQILKGLEKPVQVGEFRVACHVTQDQVDHIQKELGIDVNELINDVLINESAMSIAKHVMARIGNVGRINELEDYTPIDKAKNLMYKFANAFRPKNKLIHEKIKVNYQKKIKVKNFKDILAEMLRESNKIGIKGKLGFANFAVCNAKTSAILKDNSEYAFAPSDEESNKFKPSTGAPFAIGKIAGITIYVDPNMLYSDTNVYIGCKTPERYPGLKLFVYPGGIESTLQTEGAGAPKMVFKIQYALVDVGESCKLMYRKFQYKDNLKLF